MPTIHQSLLRITSRFVLFCMIVVCRCGFIAVEQPRSSLMPKYVYFKDLAANLEKFLEWSHVNLCLDKQTKSIGKTMLGVVFEKCYIFWSQWYMMIPRVHRAKLDGQVRALHCEAYDVVWDLVRAPKKQIECKNCGVKGLIGFTFLYV